MARYRIGETPQIDGDPLTQDIILGAAIFGLLMGIGFIIAGWHGKQYWLVFWGGGLTLASIAYLFYIALW